MYRRGIVKLTVCACAHRSGSSAARLLAAAGCVVVFAVMGCSRSSATGGALARDPSAPVGPIVAVPPPVGSTYTLLQMNLCLSGLAGCYGKARYPGVVEEAVARIREAHPDAVTFNEACRSDVALIARRDAPISPATRAFVELIEERLEGVGELLMYQGATSAADG